MPIEKADLAKLTKFAKVFADARERDANESDTVMYLIEFFKEVLDYDPLGGEISKEVAVNDRYCDFGIRLDDKIAFLVECKPAGMRGLKSKHIEQAELRFSRGYQLGPPDQRGNLAALPPYFRQRHRARIGLRSQSNR